MCAVGCPASPIDILATVDLREYFLGRFPGTPTVPCDIFTIASGEPPVRTATKFGGIPYRPAGAPWPTTAEGKPYLFGFQFCFTESMDISPSLPGDILLVFLKDEYLVTGEDDFLIFEWQQLTNSPLLMDSECPAPRWPYFHGYCCRIRSFDFVDIATISTEYRRLTDSISETLENEPMQTLLATTAARFGGIKIGGLPAWHCDPEDGGLTQDTRLLCSFGSIFPRDGVPYPFSNRANPISIQESLIAENCLNWYDAFWFYVFLDQSGSLAWGLKVY